MPLSGYYKKTEISFNPYCDHELDWVSSLLENEIKEIPKDLIKVSEGKIIESIDWEKI